MPAASGGAELDHEVIVVGAGICGIYTLHRLLGMGVDTTVLEAESGPGGTWWRNRYPGARFDSESWTYGYTFDDDLLREWEWSEHFAPQPETLRYVEHVVDRFDLRRHIQFECRIERAVWDEADGTWAVHVGDGRVLRCRFLLLAIGLLSAPTMPRIDGVERFAGRSFHTFDWPDDLDVTGLRVGVIGTGATGVQVIGAIAEQVGSLTVFQRRPNWCAPLHNSPITAEEQADIRASFDDIFARCAESPGGFVHRPLRQRSHEVDRAERLAVWEELYASPGFGIWLANYRDVLTDEAANAEFSEFIADKIRGRVDDPAVAELLIPTDHGFGTKRVPLETRYYEAYNLDHVELVDLRTTPITEVTASGISTTAAHHELDVIVYATGFDAITGAFDRIEIVGRDGSTLRDKWHHDPVNYLGVQVSGFPNLLMLNGPTAGAATSNFPRGIELSVEWITTLLQHVLDEGVTRIEVGEDVEAQWGAHIREMYGLLLVDQTTSWMNGYNSNVAGREAGGRHVIYAGGLPRYRQELDEVAADGYAGFVMTRD